MRAVRAEAHRVLQGDLVVRLLARVIAVVLQSEAAELAVRKIHHRAPAARRVLVRERVEHGHAGEVDGVARFETVVPQARTPAWPELIDALDVEARLLAAVVTVENGWQRQRHLYRALLLAMQVFGLHDVVAVARVAVLRPFPDEIGNRELARAREHR